MAQDTRLELRISQGLLDRVDAERGLVPRAAFVRDVLEKALGGSPPPDKEEDAQPRVATPAKGPQPPAPSQVPVSEEAPVADVRATESRVRPASPRSQPKAQRRQKASDAMSAALARQQALNKPKGI